ncbi:hypothetical protein LTR78_004051 [Recurvomyces mirabilis]|uniref:Glycoside hydrolase family 43 protein n=1 Tax=Recurvomyces mirabilis TaxID=574656 RepID=A0AAE1C326_9PEZI|nr:hypothetical protein LTR78_004051 [Recurvomyces mirabilis]KAK5153811.1 hypothetical protein LTS14_007030 [Recurvomyces mirabilis]
MYRSLRSLAITVGIFASTTRAQTNFSVANFKGVLAAGSGVLESLRPTSNLSFDYSPSDFYHYRDGAGQYHTGDLTLRYRALGESDWTDADTAAIRQNGTDGQASTTGLLTTDLINQLPGLAKGIKVTRSWSQQDGDLTLSFTIDNTGAESIELGSVGIPIVFNNIFSNRTAVEVTQRCSLIDPYIGLGAGYVQVTALSGTGPNLVITPLNQDSKFEAWRFLPEPDDTFLGYQIQTYEGNYAWQVYSLAYAENEWNTTEPWNPPSSTILASGGNITLGLRFSVADQVQDIDTVLSTAGLPVTVGVPGYVIPQDLPARLFVNSSHAINNITVEPAGALTLTSGGTYGESWTGYDISASTSAFGRARVTLTYADDRIQTVHYWIAHSSPTVLSELGDFLTNEQWYTNTSDPFGRGNSVITYDRSTNDYVLQDNRTWIAGVSDEGGAGSFLAAGMKQAVAPAASEVAKLETMVRDVVWRTLQISEGNDTYAVRRSIFYYQPDLVPDYIYSPEFNWTAVPGETWNKSEAYMTWRTYDYVHVSALYWSLYRAGRTVPGILTQRNAIWYLLQAYHTVHYALSNATDGTPLTDYANVGLMGEWVWGELLSDLYAENYTMEAAEMEQTMRGRQQIWASEADPYGSEMAWDSTGEEGVYFWSAYFNDTATTRKTVNAIRGYMPTVPHWGWNGNARRYWDFLYAGSIQLARIERQIHHYGSGLNALPILADYRASADPQGLDALYQLRVGYGGNSGPLTNIDAEGFGSMAFHSYPDTMHWDAYSGDYGPNFLGHVLGAATYLVNHPIFGYVSFGGKVSSTNNSTLIIVEPRDSVRQRIFVAPTSLYVTIDAGTIENFSYDIVSKEVMVNISSGRSANSTMDGYEAGSTLRAVMKWEQTGGGEHVTKMGLQTALESGLGGYLVGLSTTEASCVLFTAC